MKIQLASDLQLEFLSRSFPGERVIPLLPGADVLVLAGDIADGADACNLFADWPTAHDHKESRKIMLEIHTINGQNCPVLVCDLCGERLVDAGKAAVVFNNFAPNNSKITAFHVHKGTIDGKTCHEEADTMIRAGGGTPGWQEMKRSLTDLVANSGFSADKMAEYDKQSDF